MSISNKRTDIMLSGSGGQGLITAGIVLAEAAGVYDDYHVVQTQSYGPEARGGASRAEIVISKKEISYPKSRNLDILLAMTQTAVDKYFHHLKSGGYLIVDETFVKHVPTSRAVKIPITMITKELTGREVSSNMLALGLVVGISSIVRIDSLKKAMIGRIPKGTEEMNLKCLTEGLTISRKFRTHTVVKDEVINDLDKKLETDMENDD